MFGPILKTMPFIDTRASNNTSKNSLHTPILPSPFSSHHIPPLPKIPSIFTPCCNIIFSPHPLLSLLPLLFLQLHKTLTPPFSLSPQSPSCCCRSTTPHRHQSTFALGHRLCPILSRRPLFCLGPLPLPAGFPCHRHRDLQVSFFPPFPVWEILKII